MNSSRSLTMVTFLRGLLGVLLLWAAVSKLANPTEFLGSIYGYELPLPRGLLQTAAVVLPWVELLCGLMLLTGFGVAAALLLAVAMMIVFVFATGQAWLRGLDISCGCFNLKIFGISEQWPGFVKFLESVAFAFFRNLALTALAGWLLWRARRMPVVRANS
jgi:putative oxidoreductase